MGIPVKKLKSTICPQKTTKKHQTATQGTSTVNLHQSSQGDSGSIDVNPTSVDSPSQVNDGTPDPLNGAPHLGSTAQPATESTSSASESTDKTNMDSPRSGSNSGSVAESTNSASKPSGIAQTNTPACGSQQPVDDPYDFEMSESDVPQETFKNSLGVEFGTGDIMVLGKTAKTYELVKVEGVLECTGKGKVQVTYIERKRERKIGPYVNKYKDPFAVRFNHLLYKLSSKTELSASEEATIKKILRITFDR